MDRRLGTEAGMDLRMCGAAGRSALSQTSGSVVQQTVQPEQSSDQPGRSIQDSILQVQEEALGGPRKTGRMPQTVQHVNLNADLHFVHR